MILYPPYAHVICPDRLDIRTVDFKQQFEEVHMQYFINLLQIMLEIVTEELWWTR